MTKSGSVHSSIDNTHRALQYDIRYKLFRTYVIIGGILSIVFGIINIVNRRPMVNVVTALVALAFCVFWYFLSTQYRYYSFARITFLAAFSLLWLPFGYITSPGSHSAMPYLALLVVFILTLVARRTWEYMFPLLMLFQMPILFRSELWFPHWYEPYIDQAYRLNDLSINFSVVAAAIIATSIFMMLRYDSFNSMMYYLSVKDDLTKLYNKRYFLDILEKEYSRFQRTGSLFAVVFIDVNNFKRVNDRFGHLAGDRVLQSLAHAVLQNTRSYDVAARFGGDEFILLLPDTSAHEATLRMVDVDKEFTKITREYDSVQLSVSWGIADSKDRSIQEIIEQADQDLYRKKREVQDTMGN